MSKNFRKFRDFEYDEDYYRTKADPIEIKERRKMKRIKNAIRSKNVESLMRDLDDDYDMY